ncbi:MAG: hypothetical protein G01um101438_496 [Parcubacteria group bacterium Gr01-1014_38]|nr:MAG: hypothetical protein G01um101438_496 [Parcubacteria group bacterium Gr01-1014_38]
MSPTVSPELITVVGETNFRNVRRAFGIKRDDRRRHLYVIGKTGSGKTTVLENMAIQDIQHGEGLAVVDPHGDFATTMLDYVSPNRINDVIYFDPSDAEFPVAFNVLETVRPEDSRFAQEKNLVTSGLVGVFKKLWADSWGPRLEYILRNTILALLDSPGNTLLGILRILVDKDFRKEIVSNIRDPVVKSFWVDEFAQYNERFRQEAIAPIQNKVGQFLTSSIIRNIIGQPNSTIDLREIMDQKKVFIMNLSKGKIGEDNAALLGAMMITKIQLAAMDRAQLPEEQRQDFYLYVDEFQNFATESFATILSEARKYRLDIIMAHQYITQMSEEVRDAVFGNVGTTLCFRIGAYDAEFLEREFAPHFTETDLVNLDKYNAYIKLMIDGTASKPFSMMTIPLGSRSPWYGEAEKIIRVSRERHGRPREVVEEKISRWSSKTFRQAGEEESAAYTFERRQEQQRSDHSERREFPRPHTRTPERALPPVEALENAVVAPSGQQIASLEDRLRQEEPQRLKRAYPITCDRCGRATEVPFEPVPGKEKYCPECLAIVRAERKRFKLGARGAEQGRSPIASGRVRVQPPPLPPPPLGGLHV